MSRYPGRSPPYVRIRVELCAARGKSGKLVKTYLSRSFTSPVSYEATLERLLSYFKSEDLPKSERTRLRKQLSEAMRKTKLDLPPDIDPKQLLAKRRKIAKSAVGRFSHKEILAVFKRIPIRDFNTYSGAIQRHLVRYLAHRNESSRGVLRKQGLRWSTYVPGKARSLFAGRKYSRAKKQ